MYNTPAEYLAFTRQRLLEEENFQNLMMDVNATYLAFLEYPESLEDSLLAEVWKEKIKNHQPTKFEKLPFASYLLAYNKERIDIYSNRVKAQEDKQWQEFLERNLLS